MKILALCIVYVIVFSTCYGQDTNFPASIQVTNQGRFKGWHTGGSGLALEVGISGGQGWVLAYDRTLGTYRDLNLVAHNGSSAGIILKTNGNVGIGTSYPDYKLTVNGKIKAEELQVVVDVPADYVFASDYKLMPLSEVAKYINQNKHLPNVPSAKEIQANGWRVGEMNNKLLEKIEEVTLYLIELKKENEELRRRLEELEKRK